MDPVCRLLAAKYIRRQAKQLASQLDGVRAAEDIEFVHRARVATRRLRAAVRMSEDCFPRRQLRRWRKAIRRTTAKLGDARDRDVQIELLCGALSALSTKECFPGICRLLVQLERDRERLQRKVVAAVDQLEKKGVLRKMRRVAKRIERRTGSSADDVRTPATLERTRWHILRQLDELHRHQNSLDNPDDRAHHHAMRIAAKRLRYTLEIARPVYANRLEAAIEAAKRVQSLLGDVHDCDVWVEHLGAFAKAEHDRIVAAFGHAGRFSRLLPGIHHLREDRRCRRCEAFEQLVDYWAELGRRRVWQELRQIVLPHSLSPDAANGPDETRQASDKPLLTAGA